MKLNHFFGDPGHNFGPLLKAVGSQEGVVAEVLTEAANSGLLPTTSGVLRLDIF